MFQKDGDDPKSDAPKDEPKKDEPKSDEPKKDEPPADPEALTYDALKLPENFDRENPLAEEFLGVLNDRELDGKARADKLLDLQARAMAQVEEAQQKLWLDTNETWQNETVAFYKSEAKTEEILGRIAAQLESYDKDRREAFVAANPGKPAPEFGKALREAMTLTGAGNHPAIVQFLAWTADQLGEGSPLGGSPPASSGRSRAEIMFGNG